MFQLNLFLRYESEPLGSNKRFESDVWCVAPHAPQAQRYPSLAQWGWWASCDFRGVAPESVPHRHRVCFNKSFQAC